MDSLQLDRNVCRICLDHKIILNWNEEIFEFCGISYKDCYYKYTQLDKRGSDPFPTNLCEMCADELKNAHFLFEKALESFNILRVTLSTKKCEINKNTTVEVCKSPSQKQFKNNNYSESKSNSIQVNKFSHVSGNDTDTGNMINNSKEMSMSENITIAPSHFIDIQNIESSDNTLQEFSKTYVLQLPEPSTSKNRTKRNKSQSLIKISKDKTNDTKLTKSLDIDNFENKIEKCGTTSQSLLEENNTENWTTEFDVSSTSNNVLKTRKKYILICQYCSLKVNGTNQLKKHEATHSENRKRTETCPQCGVKLYTKMALNMHMKIHDENRQKQHKCEFCEKAFFNKGGLNVHRRIHLGLMVKCQLCPKEFFRQIDLDKHLLRHSVSPLQKNVGKKKYVVQCQYCNKSVFTTKWKEHELAHLDQPQMKCKICDKKFFSRSKCTKHLKQVHHKIQSEYEDFLHYFVDRNLRITNLRMKQQLTVQQLTE